MDLIDCLFKALKIHLISSMNIGEASDDEEDVMPDILSGRNIPFGRSAIPTAPSTTNNRSDFNVSTLTSQSNLESSEFFSFAVSLNLSSIFSLYY